MKDMERQKIKEILDDAEDHVNHIRHRMVTENNYDNRWNVNSLATLLSELKIKLTDKPQWTMIEKL
jgi:hypothetical protein